MLTQSQLLNVRIEAVYVVSIAFEMHYKTIPKRVCKLLSRDSDCFYTSGLNRKEDNVADEFGRDSQYFFVRRRGEAGCSFPSF